MSSREIIFICGIFIAVIGVTTLLFLRVLDWKARWDVVRYDGIPVLVTSRDALSTSFEIASAIRSIAITIPRFAASHPEMASMLDDFRVEVVDNRHVFTPTVPSGRLPSGEWVGGSFRVERCFPWSRKYYVAVVQVDRCGYFLVHEFARHIVPLRLQNDIDHEHKLPLYAALETAIKQELYQRMGASR